MNMKPVVILLLFLSVALATNSRAFAPLAHSLPHQTAFGYFFLLREMDEQEMAELADQKLFVDELNQIRVVNPALLQSSTKLAAEGIQFFGQFEKFIGTVKDVREAMERIGRLTEKERLKLLSLQSQLDGGTETISEESRNFQIMIGERQRELERLRVELQSLKEVEAQQSEYLVLCKKI